jgi:hypothetical protein|tara:strand:+ start:132 stop:635 length:504 start_codon:yes stop_codon:yes gene_type:complete
MAYSGRYKPNIKKYRGDPDKVVYRSMWEKYAFMWCDKNEDIKSWSSEETVVPYYYDVDKKYHRYFVDLKITFKNGKTVLVEIKPEKETTPPNGARKTKRYISEALTYVKNMNKWEAAHSFANNRGWEFQVWTEHTLRKMGIMPKETPGKLKPLKPLQPFRKKPKKKI